ncbi:hypothetical protein D3C85_1775270 [compost metagenome]
MATVKYSGSRTVSDAASISAVSHQLILKPSRLDRRFFAPGVLPPETAEAEAFAAGSVDAVIRVKPPGAG